MLQSSAAPGSLRRAIVFSPACHSPAMHVPSLASWSGGKLDAPEVLLMKRKFAILSLSITLLTAAAVGVYARRDHGAPDIATATVTRGAIVSAISATGAVEPVSTVEVGSQVTGT